MTITDQLAELVDLDSSVYRLSDYEIELVDSCEKRVRAGRELSERQAKVIAQLWEKALGGKRVGK